MTTRWPARLDGTVYRAAVGRRGSRPHVNRRPSSPFSSSRLPLSLILLTYPTSSASSRLAYSSSSHSMSTLVVAFFFPKPFFPITLHTAYTQWRIHGGANPAMGPPFSLAIDFFSPTLQRRNKRDILRNTLNCTPSRMSTLMWPLSECVDPLVPTPGGPEAWTEVDCVHILFFTGWTRPPCRPTFFFKIHLTHM